MNNRLSFAGLFILMLSAEMSGRSLLASHHNAQIAFTSTRDGNPEIYVMDADGTNQQRLTRDGWDDRHPAWPPDGSKIAFSVLGGANSFIVMMNTDGTDRKKLPAEALDGVPVLNSYPAWSPDGAKIAYYSGKHGEKRASIHLMTADGQRLKRLTIAPKGYDYDPDWFDPATLAVSTASKQLAIWGKLKKSSAILR